MAANWPSVLHICLPYALLLSRNTLGKMNPSVWPHRHKPLCSDQGATGPSCQIFRFSQLEGPLRVAIPGLKREIWQQLAM